VKLVNPGTGEISDRLTILTLKILVGTEEKRDVAHFESERTTLLQKIHARTLNAMWFDALLELGGINAMLWHAEDDLRILRRQHVELVADPKELQQLVEAVKIAFRIQALNDRRAELVTQINKEAGDGDSKEK
jgi:hypothetical protein